MEISVIGSTKPGYDLPVEEAKILSGKAAGICYMPDDIETLFAEDNEKSLKRANRAEESGHHSVFDHISYNFSIVEIPKILAMILNNEKIYGTSEKSGRYTKMKSEGREKELYEKWIILFANEIKKEYPDLTDKHVEKLAMENARLLISAFTPATTMEHTLNFRQLNYVMGWFEKYIKEEKDDSFSIKLKPVLNEFLEETKKYREPLLSDIKGRSLSIFGKFDREEEWGENYCCNYMATFPGFGQALRHRTLSLEMQIPKLEEATYFVPPIIKDTDLEKEWLDDISSLAENYPQGMLVKVNERGTVENFVQKCKERLCGCAQLEIAMITKELLDKYLENTKDKNKRVYDYLNQYSSGARCTFKDFKCTAPCVWRAKKALDRKI